VAYARAVASATSRPVTRGYLIFAGTENTHQVQVDLRATTHDETAADRFGADVR
jgi:hypothetical protein